MLPSFGGNWDGRHLTLSNIFAKTSLKELLFGIVSTSIGDTVIFGGSRGCNSVDGIGSCAGDGDMGMLRGYNNCRERLESLSLRLVHHKSTRVLKIF